MEIAPAVHAMLTFQHVVTKPAVINIRLFFAGYVAAGFFLSIYWF